MKVKPYFKTTLAKPFQGRHYHEAGASVVLNTGVHTKSIGSFLVTIPDPVSLNLNNAQNSIERCFLIKERINKAKQQTVFSQILTEDDISGLDFESIKKLDPDATLFRQLDNEKVYEYMQICMGIIVSLITSVESFVNMIIPCDFILKRTNKKGEIEELDKTQILRRLSIEDKIELLSELKGKTDIKQQVFWGVFKQIKDLRDDIIHFKKTDNKVDLIWNPIIVTFFDSDLQSFFDNIVTLISYLEPAYLEFE